jgi:glyoxylase-like metal-dependent hydrolase (beta-lactamase superfamily II)
MTTPSSVMVGEVTLTKIVERPAVPRLAGEMITGLDAAGIHDYLASSDPATVDLSTSSVFIGFHSWLVQGPGWTALIDPAVGNGKRRPTLPYLDNWASDYLDDLVGSGVSVDDVDVVISTHHHVDHVGWNTTWDGQSWVPTFPKARHVWSALEFSVFDGRYRAGEVVNHGAHADSVLPVRDAGLAELVAEDAVEGFEVLPGLFLGAASGHTAGMMVVRLVSAGERALFVGDCLHHPGQVGCAELGNHADADPGAAHRVRSQLLEEAASTRTLLVPGHFTGVGCGYVRDHRGRLRFESYTGDARRNSHMEQEHKG